MLHISAILTWIAVLGLLEVLRGYLVAHRAIQQHSKQTGVSPADTVQDTLPNVTVIRPIKGIDSEIDANLTAALHYAYPGSVQTLFVLDDLADPAYPTVRRHVDEAKARGLDVDLLLAGEPTKMTGKLHAMMVGLASAKHEIVAFADSDTRAPPTLLQDLVRPVVLSSRIGATFAPVVVANRPATAADVGYALLLNGLYGPSACVGAGRSNTLPFIMGQFMVFRRDLLDAIGGLEGTAGELVDDMSIGLRIHAAGYDNHMIHTRLPIVEQGLTWPAFLSVYRRWILFSRRGIPLHFKLPQILRVVLFIGLLALGITGILVGSAALALVGVVGALASGVVINRLHAEFGGVPTGLRNSWVVYGLLILAPYVFLRVLLARQVDWRGRVYHLDASTRLKGSSDLDAHAADRAGQRNVHPPLRHP